MLIVDVSRATLKCPWAVSAQGGIVVLNGTVTGLVAKRLAGVLAWWVPGNRDVVNGIEVVPSPEDNADEVVDAIRLVLEKDPFVKASQIRVRCSNYRVTLEGLVKNETQRQKAEADTWYVPQLRQSGYCAISCGVAKPNA